MRIIFIYFYIIYTLVNLVACLEDIQFGYIEKPTKFNDNISTYFHWNDKLDADAFLNTYQLIKKYGYPVELHVVTTDDGYILTLHRIPGKSNSHPVFLQHGLLGSSSDWILPGPKKSLAYLLADDGYDVWLGNFRGNTYSKAHKTLSTDDGKFWNFSWHEMGAYDLPAMISYVTNLTQSNLTYIGHSLGGTTFFSMAGSRLDISSKIKMMFGLSSPVYISDMKSPLRYFLPFSKSVEYLVKFFGAENSEFLPAMSLFKLLKLHSCEKIALRDGICNNILYLFAGYNKAESNATLLPVILAHTPAGTSTKTIIHLLQVGHSDMFRQFEYGPKKNFEIYNSTVPPTYDTSKIPVPISLYYADNDWFISTTDLFKTARALPNVVELYEVPYEGFTHLDFLYGLDAPRLVYNKILSTIKGE